MEENIRAVLEVTEPDRRRREADLGALMEEFGITRLRKTPSIALSGGERRRVEIARALASRPSYMLLDEPFAGIDPKAVVEIQKLVRQLTNRGIGVLITDHNVRETLDLTDRCYIIYSGAVLTEGNKDQIVNNPEVRRLYLGEDFRLFLTAQALLFRPSSGSETNQYTGRPEPYKQDRKQEPDQFLNLTFP